MSCAKCGSGPVMTGVQILDRVDDVRAEDLTAAVDKNPEAMLFRGRAASSLVGNICGSCGYVELYATDPAALLAAVRAR